jgi:UTP:GlnB (protein PII) uridylyltransferase
VLTTHAIAPPDRLASLAEAGGSTVRFDEEDDEGGAILVIETDDAPGLLLLLAETLFRQRAQIVRSSVRTLGGRVHNRFDLVEFDASPLSRRRRADVRAAVAAALAQREVRSPG